MLKNDLGLILIKDPTLVKVSGSDARKFLNGILTQNILTLKENESRYTCMCTKFGKVLLDAWIYFNGSFFIFIRPDLSEKLLKYLAQYVIAEDVQVELLSDVSNVRQTLPFLNQIDNAVSGMNDEALEIFRIESCLPKYGVDFNEENLPEEANLHDALSFDKGCYVGQETIARQHNLGHVNKQLMLFKVEGDKCLAPGEKIYLKDQEVGWVTSSCNSKKYNSVVVMGYLKYAYLNEWNSEFKITERASVLIKH